MRHSGSVTSNPNLIDWTNEYRDKDNLRFFADALVALGRQGVGNGGLMAIGLLGQRDIPGVTLRRAQSVLRWDLHPSRWSHAFLIVESVQSGQPGSEQVAADQVASATILELALHPRTGKFPLPENNGVSQATLGLYRDPTIEANAALLAVTMSDGEAQSLAERARLFNIDRVRYNLWDMLGIWHGYLWAFGERPNPLREGVPIPTSAYLEMVFEGLGIDLTPGTSERNSAPEHIWNGVRWWHQAFEAQNRPVAGYYVTRDPGCTLAGTDDALSSA